VLCGLDWAEDHHDVALVDPDGNLVSKRRISDDAAGFTQLLQLLTDAGDSAEDPIPVAIETSRGLLVACLRATGRKVYAINPKSVDRYRDRHSVARKKSDAGDALVLAHILRTDRAAHRPLPADSELAQAIAVLARAQQDAVWERTCAHNKLRSLLREYYPAILSAFAPKRGGILRPEARAILAAAPTPRTAATLTKTQLRALLVRAGRRRGIDADAERLQTVLRAEYLHHPPVVENAFGVQAVALLRQLDTASMNAEQLDAAAVAHFEKHPDAEIISSLPGLGSLTGARVLAEIGDDRSRFADARSLKAYAGSAPVTRASGKSLAVMHRRVKNQRLAAVGYSWAFSALTASPGARAHYDRRKTAGDRHTAAQRNLFNRLIGCLHHCLDTGQTYNEKIAFPPPETGTHEPAA
jgi:transposase